MASPGQTPRRSLLEAPGRPRQRHREAVAAGAPRRDRQGLGHGLRGGLAVKGRWWGQKNGEKPGEKWGFRVDLDGA